MSPFGRICIVSNKGGHNQKLHPRFNAHHTSECTFKPKGLRILRSVTGMNINNPPFFKLSFNPHTLSLIYIEYYVTMGGSFDYVETLLKWWSTLVASAPAPDTTRRWYGTPIKARVRLNPFAWGWSGGSTPFFLSLSPLSYLYIISLVYAYISI